MERTLWCSRGARVNVGVYHIAEGMIVISFFPLYHKKEVDETGRDPMWRMGGYWAFFYRNVNIFVISDPAFPCSLNYQFAKMGTKRWLTRD